MSDKAKPALLVEGVARVLTLGSRQVLAACTIRRTQSDDVPERLRERVLSSCSHFSPKIRRHGCSVEVSAVGFQVVGRARKQLTSKQILDATTIADPEKVASMAHSLMQDCLRGLTPADSSDVGGIIEDVVGTATRVIVEGRAWLPRIHDLANGNMAGVVAGLGQDMMQDEDGQKVFKSVLAAAAGDAAAQENIKNQTQDMGGLGQLLQGLLSTMGSAK